MEPLDRPPPSPAPRPNRLVVLVGVVVAAVVVSRLAGGLLRWVSAVGTATHEAGHALVADVLTGKVASITVFREGGGVTFSQPSTSDWRTFLVSAAGYLATLVAALALLSAVLFARSSRLAAAIAAGAALVALLLWAPLDPVVAGIEPADQHFTFLVLLVSALLLAAVAALPARLDTARRIVLGAFAVGLLADAFQAGRDLVLVERLAGRTATDADGLAAASGLFDAATWAWLLRSALFVLAVAWAAVAVRRLGPSGAPRR